MKQKILFLKGLPSSGKSTFAKQLLKDDKIYRRVNKDDLRSMSIHKWSRSKEESIKDAQVALTKHFIDSGFNVVVDNTHFSGGHEELYESLSKDRGVEFEVKFFDAGVETCVIRDSRRENSVGEGVIRGMYEKYKNDYDFVEYDTETYVEDESLPKAIIRDIDGTLAHMVDRGPYEGEKVLNDTLDEMVSEYLFMCKMAGYKILIFTGREDVNNCGKLSKERLDKHHIPYDEFHIREGGDQRPDYVVKSEMFDKVRDKYNVKLVVDDRKQVVKYRRSIGMKVFHVDRGNF